MKRHTIKWRILKYNLAVIFMMITLVIVIFNIAIRFYIENNTVEQLGRIASHTQDIALEKGPDFFQKPDQMPPPPKSNMNSDTDDKYFQYYFMLDRGLREPLSVINADYILLDSNMNIINPSPEEYYNISPALSSKITAEAAKIKNLKTEAVLKFHLSGTDYIAIVKPVYDKNSFGLGWIIIFSGLQNLTQLQIGINTILFIILIFSALIAAIFSSYSARKIYEPFSSLNNQLNAIAERNFGTKTHIPVDDELQEFVSNINIMSEKLETYDEAQKTFLQNASHEFRTPLMSIQSYAEGIKYDVVDNDTAVKIILDETQRMKSLVEDLLYLSRLDAIEENYNYEALDLNDVIKSCINRVNGIAVKNSLSILYKPATEDVLINADEEKLSRAITNIINNCLRYAQTTVTISTAVIDNKIIKLEISDDGPGFDPQEIPNIFERFYKGKKGHIGLGLAISKNVVLKHNGTIIAQNSASGALFIIELPIIS